MYTYQAKVGYSKIDRYGKVPFYEIMNYLQDSSNFQSEELGVGARFLMERGQAWVLIAYKLEVFEPLKLGENITVGTAPTDFGVFGTRQYFIKNEKGDYKVKADTLWAMIDIENRAPIRIPDENKEIYRLEKLFDDIKVSRKFNVDGEKSTLNTFKVLKTYIDTNGHMNNADYLRAAEEYLPKDKEFRGFQIIYSKEALEGEEITPSIYKQEDGIGMTFENKEGQLLTKIKFY